MARTTRKTDIAPSSGPKSSKAIQIGSLGFIQGEIKADKSRGELCQYFGGVPYALPPTGPKRWKRPQSLPNNSYGTEIQPLICRSWTGVCPQPEVVGQESTKSRWTEDCLQCNVWVPTGKAPASGWPVLFFIHGGFLQWGHPNSYIPSLLLGQTDCKCILVIPAYRLNVFGFLAPPDLQAADASSSHSGCTGNFGFWDQREALEWTARNIHHFGGNRDFITLGGFSAGGYSAYHQLGYDLLMSKTKRPYIKRLFIQSNGPGVQPRSVESAQEQFDELLALLEIPASHSATQKMQALRETSPEKLIAASEKMQLHEFRAVSDDAFVSRLLFESIDSGELAGLMRKHGVEVLISEVRDEATTYAKWRPPTKTHDIQSLRRRLEADYPRGVVDAIMRHWEQNGSGELNFGKIYASVQVHLTSRGFASKLAKHGAGHLVRRVRTEWLASTAKRWTHKAMGVTHGTDTPIWLWGNGEKLDERDKATIQCFVGPVFWDFVNGRDVQSTAWWKSLDRPDFVRTLKEDGSCVNERDGLWDESVRFWDAVREAAWAEY